MPITANINSIALRYCAATTTSSSSTPKRRLPRVVIIGSGWGGFTLARRLDKSLFDVRLISPRNHFLFTPLLPSTAVGTLEFRAIQEPVRTIRDLGEYYQAKARGVDSEGKFVICEDVFKGAEFNVKYDYLVVAAGAKTNTFGINSVNEREGKEVFFLKQLSHARQIRNRAIECFERATSPLVSDFQRKRLLQLIVVGGGPTSCEYTSEVYDFVVNDLKSWYPDLLEDVKVTLVEAGPGLLGGFDRALADYYKDELISHNVDVKTGTAVTGIEERYEEDGTHYTVALLSDGTELPFGTMVWSAGLAPTKFIQNSNMELQPGGRVGVDKYLRVPGEAGRIFAMGDCASVEDLRLPPTASVAEQQATYLGDCFNKYYRESTQTILDDERVPKEERVDLPLPGPIAPALMPWTGIEFLNKFVCKPAPYFQYKNRGRMAGMGFGGGVTDLTGTELPMPDAKISGLVAFLTWRTTYLTKQLSWSNMLLIPMYWFKALVFGRDISRF